MSNESYTEDIYRQKVNRTKRVRDKERQKGSLLGTL